MLQQRHVEDVAGRFAVAAQRAGDADGGVASTRSSTYRLPHSNVGNPGEPEQQLGQPDRRFTHRDSVSPPDPTRRITVGCGWSAMSRQTTCPPGTRLAPRGHHERPQERPGAQPRRPAVDRRRVPARQARQGRRVRADDAEERALRQGRGPHVQRRHQGRDRDRGQARDDLPVPGGHATTSSWTARPTTRCTCRPRRSGRTPTTCWTTPRP